MNQVLVRNEKKKIDYSSSLETAFHSNTRHLKCL